MDVLGWIRLIELFAFAIALLAGVGGAGLAINFPGFLDQSAREIGISSGADLTLYLVVLSLLTLSGYMVGKFRRLEQRLSRLVHELAVRDAESNRVTRTTDLRRES